MQVASRWRVRLWTLDHLRGEGVEMEGFMCPSQEEGRRCRLTGGACIRALSPLSPRYRSRYSTTHCSLLLRGAAPSGLHLQTDHSQSLAI